MKPRGVAFAVEAISLIDEKDEIDDKEAVFGRMERVILVKIDDFISHYVVKCLSAFRLAGCGSGQLYDACIQNLLGQFTALRYSDVLRFLEVYPRVTHIYEHTMTDDICYSFLQKVGPLLKDNKFPADDLCRVFAILIDISPYLSTQGQ
jgi:hypothetical protein